jgi:pimeloyl-ACP methyl ester carboxylesterase
MVGMTLLQRPDGTEIHWEAHGAGPTVLLSHLTLWSWPGAYRALLAELVRDHRFLIYDPRGCGNSTRSGPYEPETDAADLEAVLDATGGTAVVIAVGDGINRAARVGAARPELVERLVAIVPGPAAILPRTELQGSGVMGASDSVIQLLIQMMKTDPRAAVRSVLAAVNPALDEDEHRERIEILSEYLSFEAAYDRATRWLQDDVAAELRAFGERLWIVYGGDDPLFEGELGTRVREFFPEAQIEELADGPISRPDLTAALVRRLTKAGRTAS